MKQNSDELWWFPQFVQVLDPPSNPLGMFHMDHPDVWHVTPLSCASGISLSMLFSLLLVVSTVSLPIDSLPFGSYPEDTWFCPLAAECQ